MIMKAARAERPVRDGGCERGQATVEYAVVAGALVAVVVGLGALWRLAESGALVDHAVLSASHHIHMATLGGGADVLLY